MTRGPGRPSGPAFKPPPGHELLTDAELEEYSKNSRDFFNRRRRAGWLLALAERHRLVPIRSSVIARNCLVLQLLPDLFPAWYRPSAFTRDLGDLDLALSMLGETRKVKVKTEKGMPPTLRVEASSRAEAIEHLASLGIEPITPLSATNAATKSKKASYEFA